MNVWILSVRELARLLRGRLTWLAAALTVLSPLAGLTVYRSASADTMQSLYVANPALAGGVLGGLLFALLTLCDCARTSRCRVEVLCDAAVSPLTAALARLMALLGTAALTLALTLLTWLPWTAHTVGAVFDGGDYLLAYLILMGLALPLCILLAGAAWQFTRRFDLSLVLVAALAALSLTIWRDNWQLCWLNPCVWALSDDFSNFRILRSAAYMRLTWLLGLAGLWALSYLCIRRYGRGPLGSLARTARRVYRPLLAAALLLCCGWSCAAQPFIDHSNPDLSAMTFLTMEPLEGVACLRRSVQVTPDTRRGTVEGTASYQLQNTTGQEQTVALGVTPGYTISNVRANGVEVPFSVSDYQEYNEAKLEVAIPAEEQVELTLEYGGFPQEDLPTMQGGKELSGEYLCLENAALSPRLMNVMPGEDGYPATIEITLPAAMTVIPFGASEAEVVAEHGDGTKTWRYETNRAGGILYAGDYVREEIQAGGLTIDFYYGRKHQAVMEAAGAAEAVLAVMDYCAGHYGSLAFGDGERLKLIQSRVAGGGYAGDGASLLDEADFTAHNLGDADKGGGAAEVMIHELVHQWWGLGNMFDTADPWSAEGLTCYTTYRIAKELYGEDYAREHYVDQWRGEVEDYYLNFYVRHPEYLEALPEAERLAISNSLSGMRQYSEIPLNILKAEELVGGEAAMDEILRGLFNRELDWSYPYLTYQEFLDACGLTEEELDLGQDISI